MTIMITIKNHTADMVIFIYIFRIIIFMATIAMIKGEYAHGFAQPVMRE